MSWWALRWWPVAWFGTEPLTVVTVPLPAASVAHVAHVEPVSLVW